MISKKVALFIFFSVHLTAFSQEKRIFESIGFASYNTPLAQAQLDGMKYLYHPQSDILIDDIDEHAAGMFVIIKEGSYGVLNHRGDLLVPAEYDHVKLVTSYDGQWSENTVYNYKFIIIRQNGLYGFANENGEIIIPPTYKNLKVISKNLIGFYENELWGWMDAATGKVLQSPLYDEIRDFYNNDHLTVTLNHKTGLAHKNGKLIIPMEYDEFFTYIYTRSHTYINTYKNQKSYLYDSTGKIVFNFPYESIQTLRGSELILFTRNKLYGAADPLTGKEVFAPEFTRINESIKGLLKVQKNGKYGVIDQTGKYIVSAEFSGIDFFNADGLLRSSDYQMVVPVVVNDDKYTEDRKKRELYENEIEQYPYFILVKQGNNSSLLNWQGKKIIETGAYTMLTPIYNQGKSYIKININNQYGIADSKGKIILPVEYKFIMSYPYSNHVLSGNPALSGRYICFSKGNSSDSPIGLFDLQQEKVIIEPLQSRIYWLNEDFLKVEQLQEDYTKNISVYNKNGNLLFQAAGGTEDIATVGEQLLLIQQNGLQTLADINGKTVYENPEWKTRTLYANIRFPEYKGFTAVQFHHGLFKIHSQEGNLFVDKNVKEQRFKAYDQVDHFYNGYAIAAKKTNSKSGSAYLFGVIDLNGKEVIPCEYTNISNIYDVPHLLIATKDQYKGVITRDGKILIDAIYSDISAQGQYKYFKLYKDGLEGLADLGGKIIIPVKYEHIHTNYDGEKKIWPALVKDNGWYYFIGKDGKVSAAKAKIKN